MKKIFVMLWLVLLCGIVGTLFWYNEWRYHLPTPIPAGYQPVKPGTLIHLNPTFTADQKKPVFLHFFNPDCPCSRFNIASFRALVKQYREKINFMVVVMNNDRYTAQQIQSKFDLDIPISFDASLAKACGVYSTPQAVLLDNRHELYYRGNYNISRYCTDEKTNYAKMAITGLMNDHSRLIVDPLALRAYGCSLPNCTR